MSDKETLSVLVFEGNRPSRTFTVSARWVTKLGLVLGAILAVSIITSGLAIRFYRTAKHSSPWRIQELEQKISELNANQQKINELKPPSSSTTHTSTVDSILFSALPTQTIKPSSTAAIPIIIEDIKTFWSTKHLEVSFNIKYTQTDGGNQQGHIIILARGPDTLLVYPAGAFNPSGTSSLIAINKGEYFSVSRFRETKAKFGPVNYKDSLQSVEILILGAEDEILIHQIVKTGENAETHPSTPLKNLETQSPPNQ